MKTPISFRDEDWARLRRDWTAFWAGETNRPMVVIEQLDPARPPQGDTVPPYRLPLDWPADKVLDYYEDRMPAVRYFGNAWPKWWPNWGPGIAAGFLGCNVRPAQDTVWFEPPADAPPIDRLRIAADGASPWQRRIRELTTRAVQRWGGQVSVAHTDLGGNLDILSSFRTAQQLLFDVIENPGEVERLVGQITQCWLKYYDELHAIIAPAGTGTTPWAPIWSPLRCYMLQCDFSYMIGPRMFERFVLPDLTACCDRLDHGFYHLDGKGQIPHLDMLLAMPRLRGIQWIPGSGQAPAEDWPEVLGRVVRAGKLCQVFVDPKGAMKIKKELGGKGFVLAVGVGDMKEKEVRDLVAALSR
jgi:5-methyltetrahydrofolate--homocysteine methyltransferase